MDKNILIQYNDLVEEVKDLRRRIQKTQDDIDKLEIVTDSVKGTRRDGTIGNITITGFPSPRYYKLKNVLHTKQSLLRKKEGELLELINQIDGYINSIDDSRIRRIMRYRYIDDLNWQQVARKMGKKATADSCRKTHDRFFEEK